MDIDKVDKNDEQEWQWCLVGNIVDEHEYGEEHIIKSGTKHFRPNAKVYINMVYGGMGHENILVIGMPRHLKKYIEIVIARKYVCNFRMQKVYKPAVLNRMKNSKWEWWGNTEESRSRIIDFLTYLNPEEAAKYILPTESECQGKSAPQNIEANGETWDKAPRSKKFHSGSVMEICFIIAIVLFMAFGAIINNRNTSDSGGKTQQTEQFSEENEELPAATELAEQASAGSSEAAEEPVSTEVSTPKKVDQSQARDYFKDEIWEVKRASIFIHQQSGGQAYLKLKDSFDSKPLYQEEELLGNYYNFTVSEVLPDSTEVRNCFYVKEDLSEILCMETATGNLYDLESWRNSSEYAERMRVISNWQQEREERLLASEGQALNEPWYDAYRAIVADWTLIEDSEWSSDFEYLDFYFGEDYQFDSYWLCDIDQNGTPELFLYSKTRHMTGMVAVVTYTDRPVVVIVDMIDGINLETAECIIHGHWHGAGGSPENEWTGYRIQGDTAEYSMYIDYYDYNEEDIENHYVIYHPETDEFEDPVDGREYEEIYAAHVANCIWTWDIHKYDLVDDLSGLKVIYK